jgi:hypothetical protein
MNRMPVLMPRLLLGLFFILSTAVSTAQPSDKMVLPAPKGLVACAPDDPLVRTLRLIAAPIGEAIGCFHSTERIQLKGVPRDSSQPLETAFALNIAPSLGPYSKGDLEAMFLKVSEQWKNYKPLSHHVRPEYERMVNAMIASSLPTNAPPVSLKLEPPILVSIERIGNGSYMVVSIRKRRIQAADNTFVSTAVDSTAITLRNGALIRVSLARELRQPADIQAVHDETAAWLTQVANATRNH